MSASLSDASYPAEHIVPLSAPDLNQLTGRRICATTGYSLEVNF